MYIYMYVYICKYICIYIFMHFLGITNTKVFCFQHGDCTMEWPIYAVAEYENQTKYKNK